MLVMNVTMDAIDAHTFNVGIFMSLGDILAPVYVDVERAESQSLLRILNEKHHILADKTFFPWAAIAGVGQYSLRGTPRGFLAKRFCQVRNASLDEMSADAEYWGDQVLGPFDSEAGPEWDENQRFDYRNHRVVYSGPQRLVRTVFATRTFTGEIPEDLTELREAIDTLQFPYECELVPQDYTLFHAENGVVSQEALKDPRIHNPESMRPYCTVQHERVVNGHGPTDYLWATAASEGAERTDFSEAVAKDFWQAWAVEQAFDRMELQDHSLSEDERIAQARLFRMPEGAVRSLMLKDPFVGISAGACSNCYHPVAFCDNSCKPEEGGCGYAFGSVTGPKLDVWENMDLPLRLRDGFEYCSNPRNW